MYKMLVKIKTINIKQASNLIRVMNDISLFSIFILKMVWINASIDID